MSKAHENGNGALLEPRVRVKPVSGWPTWRSRSMWLLLVLSVLLIAAITTGFILIAATHPSPKVQVTVTPPPSNDVLVSDKGAWVTSQTFFFDSSGRYHIVNTSTTQSLVTAFYGSNQLNNFRLQVTMNQVAGPVDDGDFYGVVLRSSQDQSHYYLFGICPYNGQYEFERFDGAWHYLANGTVSSLHTARGQSNTIIVEISGNSFTFRINGVPIHNTAFTDSLFPSITTGEVGLSVEEDNVNVAFSHMTITRLP